MVARDRHYRAGSRFAVLALASIVLAAAAAIPSSERDALLELHAATSGAAWTRNDGWGGPPGTECGWWGIACDPTLAYVVGVNLGSNNLVGTLPNLEGLTALSVFGADRNRLSGTIPALGKLTGLKVFDVSRNNTLTGPLPNLDGLDKLEYFDVGFNRLTGVLPSLDQTPSLRAFFAHDNELTGHIPSLAKLPALVHFSVSQNHLTGPIPSLAGLSKLTSLNLGWNFLTGPIPDLSDLTSLAGFYVRENLLTGPLPPSFRTLVSLLNVDLNDNQLDGPFPDLTALTNLLVIQAGSNRFSGPMGMPPNPSALLPGLSWLCLNHLESTGDAAADMVWAVATSSGVIDGEPGWLFCQPAVAPPVLVRVASRKVHGSAGTFDLPLRDDTANPAIEPRIGPDHAIVFTFDKPVTSGTAAVMAGNATLVMWSFSGAELIVPLTGVADAQYVTVAVRNVTSADYGTGGAGSVRIGFLAGDVNQSRVVTLADLLAVNAVLSQFVSEGNYLKDVNLSGTLTLSDKLFVNGNLTELLPAP